MRMATTPTGCAPAGQAAEWGRNPPPPATPGAGDPKQLAEHPDPDPSRQPLLQSAGHRLVPRQRCRLHSRRGAHHDLAQAVAELETVRWRVLKRRRRRTRSAGQGILRRRRQLEPCRAHHRPDRGRRPRCRHRFIVTTLPVAKPRRSTRMSTAGAALPRTTSSRGRRISPPTAPPAQEGRPTSSGCSCIPAPTG